MCVFVCLREREREERERERETLASKLNQIKNSNTTEIAKIIKRYDKC